MSIIKVCVCIISCTNKYLFWLHFYILIFPRLEFTRNYSPSLLLLLLMPVQAIKVEINLSRCWFENVSSHMHCKTLLSSRNYLKNIIPRLTDHIIRRFLGCLTISYCTLVLKHAGLFHNTQMKAYISYTAFFLNVI